MNNLPIAIVSFVIFVTVVLAAARAGKTYLFGLSITFILISNVTVQVNTEILPGVTISWAIIIYSLVYLITDLVIEFYGKKTAYELAATNLGVQILFWLYVWLSLKASPAASGNSAQAYDTMKALFSTTAQITIAAIVAALGPFADIFTTHKIRNYLKGYQFFGGQIINLLIRAKLSTLFGEVINTVLFFSIALMGTNTDSMTLLSIVVSATIAKWIISAADAPFLWAYFRYIGAPADVSAEIRSELPD